MPRGIVDEIQYWELDSADNLWIELEYSLAKSFSHDGALHYGTRLPLSLHSAGQALPMY